MSNVNPSHYKRFKIKPTDIIREYRFGFFLGNLIKYVCRHKLKNGREDLCKALWYLLAHLNVPEEKVEEITEYVSSLEGTVEEPLQERPRPSSVPIHPPDAARKNPMDLDPCVNRKG